MTEINENEKSKIIAEYLNGASYAHLERKYLIGRKPLRKLINDSGIEKRLPNSKYKLSDVNKMIEFYRQGKTMKEIAMIFKEPCRQNIQSLLRTYMDENEKRILKRKYGQKKSASRLIYHNLLDNLQNEGAAYLLGYILTDGYLKSNSNTIGISYSEIDTELTETFKSILNGGFTYYYSPKHYYDLRWNSDIMYEKLLAIGVYPNKSLTLRFPAISDANIPAILRGILEGDGTIITDNGRILIKIYSASWDFLLDIKQFIDEQSIHCLLYPQTKSQTTHALQIGASREAIKFLNWIYKDCKYFLSRKYNKYIEFLKENPEYADGTYLNTPNPRLKKDKIYPEKVSHHKKSV